MRKNRREERVTISSTAIITVFEEDFARPPVNGVVLNLSPHGLGMRTQKPIKLQTDVEISLKFIDPNGKDRTETVYGRVVWVREIFPDYFFGAELMGLNTIDHPGLQRYLQAEAQTKS